jgi:hypothetical protein
VTVQYFHVWTAWAPRFDEIARFMKRHASVDVKIRNGDRGRSITAGVAMEKHRMSISCEGV